MTWGLLIVLTALALPGCRQDMHDQARDKTFAYSEFFPDHRSARPVLAGTVARGHLQLDEQFYTGKANGGFAQTFPFPITTEVLDRGQQRFDIYCSPCHGRTGEGNGMVVQRGFRKPPSYSEERLLKAPPGHFFDVITNGSGVMYDYADRIAPADRWAIVAYIRALQLSQNAGPEDVPAGEQGKIAVPTTAPAGSAASQQTDASRKGWSGQAGWHGQAEPYSAQPARSGQCNPAPRHGRAPGRSTGLTLAHATRTLEAQAREELAR